MTARIRQAELETLVRMHRAGLRQKAIAPHLGVSASGISYWLGRLGLRRRKGGETRQTVRLANDMRRGRIYLLRGQGLRLQQVALALGMKLDSFRAWMRRQMPDIYGQLKSEWPRKRAP